MGSLWGREVDLRGVQTSGRKYPYREQVSPNLIIGFLIVSSERLEMVDLQIFGKIPGWELFL